MWFLSICHNENSIFFSVQDFKMRFEVLMAQTIRSCIFWDMILCSLLSSEVSEKHVTSIFMVEE